MLTDYSNLITDDVVVMLQALALGVLVVALAVFALVTVVKQVGAAIAGPGLWDRPAAKAVLRALPLLLGVALGLLPGVFASVFPPTLSALLGLIAGFNADGIYSKVKAWAPRLLLTREHRKGKS